MLYYNALDTIINIVTGTYNIRLIDEHKNLHFDNNQDVHLSSETLRGKRLQPCEPSRTESMFHILGEVGVVENSDHLRPHPSTL